MEVCSLSSNAMVSLGLTLLKPEKLQQTKYEKALIVCINQVVKRRIEEKVKSFAGMKISVIEVSELNQVLNLSGENK